MSKLQYSPPENGSTFRFSIFAFISRETHILSLNSNWARTIASSNGSTVDSYLNSTSVDESLEIESRPTFTVIFLN